MTTLTLANRLLEELTVARLTGSEGSTDCLCGAAFSFRAALAAGNSADGCYQTSTLDPSRMNGHSKTTLTLTTRLLIELTVGRATDSTPSLRKDIRARQRVFGPPHSIHSLALRAPNGAVYDLWRVPFDRIGAARVRLADRSIMRVSPSMDTRIYAVNMTLTMYQICSSAIDALLWSLRGTKKSQSSLAQPIVNMTATCKGDEYMQVQS